VVDVLLLCDEVDHHFLVGFVVLLDLLNLIVVVLMQMGRFTGLRSVVVVYVLQDEFVSKHFLEKGAAGLGFILY
jgi:hypothetical protein